MSERKNRIEESSIQEARQLRHVMEQFRQLESVGVERVVLAANLVAGKVDVGDRGYEKCALFNDIAKAR